MRGKVWFTIVPVAILAVFAAMSLAGAETMESKGRHVFHYVKVEVIKVGDVDGHVVGIAEARGLSFDESVGEVANYSNRVMFDYTNGSGPHQGYDIITYEDGSTLMEKFEGTTTALPGGVSSFRGIASSMKGTGRFEGIKGRGSYSGKRLAPLTPGGAADCYADWSRTYTLPSR